MDFTNYSDVPMSDRTGRHFTVAVFVVHEGKVLLHHHRKLGMWLPPGGHIEENELPDDAALREVYEEAGVEVRLVGERRDDIEEPRQLYRPAGVQLEYIAEGHYHIDLIYFAKPKGEPVIHEENDGDQTGFYGPEEWDALGVNDEVRGWCERALKEVF
ncbi:NUDIX hydrolase [Rubrobacter indicoceani]|uniref:NUDIX hydrolase n=1 Tax=Rubrobacter indicoceani TaxID=2051957 RepID=UPI000E5A7677|nr:NUDIX domain-containing protein [Rubrobacter indicoceani]